MNKLFCLALLICPLSTEAAPFAQVAENYLQMANVNIAYEAVISSQLTPYSIEDYAKRNIVVEPKWQTDISFWAEGNRFDLEAKRLGGNGDFFSFCYDGSQYSSLHGPASIIMVSKKNPMAPPAMWNRNPLLFPAAFLALDNAVRYNITSNWGDLIKPEFWSSASKLLTSKTQKFSGIFGVISGNKVVVLTDEQSAFGLSGFEVFQGETDKPWMKYTLSEIGEATFVLAGQKKIFLYPKKATLESYDPSGNLVRTDIAEITKVAINDPQFDEGKLTMDPGQAQRIYDSDSDTWINVPK
jgi:hypothetical protein